ncbi:MAG: hypothetical protein RLZZ224_134 [Verrucomicrobiota bacterium]
MGDGEVEFWILLRSLSYEGQVLNVEFFSHTKARRHEGGKMGGEGWEAGRLRHGGPNRVNMEDRRWGSNFEFWEIFMSKVGKEFWILLRSLSFLLCLSYEGQDEGQVLNVGCCSHTKTRRREDGWAFEGLGAWKDAATEGLGERWDLVGFSACWIARFLEQLIGGLTDDFAVDHGDKMRMGLDGDFARTKRGALQRDKGCRQIRIFCLGNFFRIHDFSPHSMSCGCADTLSNFAQLSTTNL